MGNDAMALNVESLNKDIELFSEVYPIENWMKKTFSGVSRLVMLDRYAYKDIEKKTLKEGDFVVLTVKDDPKFPARGLGYVKKIDWDSWKAVVKLEEEFISSLEDPKEIETGEVERSLDLMEKPLEIYYEQIAKRVARGLASNEVDEGKRKEFEQKYFEALVNLDFVPAGRVLKGAGTSQQVTYFNCFSGDTIVQTANGPEYIKNLKGEVNVYSQDGVIRKAVFKSYGVQELYRVVFENGEELKATKGHEWVILDPKTYKKIKVTTDKLEGKKIPIVKTSRPAKNSEYIEGVCHGIVYGDGTLIRGANKSQVLLFGDKKELATYFEGLGRIVPHYDEKYVGVYGLPDYFKELPGEEKSRSYIYGFISGLIATDGSCDDYGSVKITSSNLEGLEKIGELLGKVGLVKHGIRVLREESNFGKDYRPCYGLQIVKQTLDIDDLLLEKHKEKFRNAISQNRRDAYMKVVKVEYLGIEEEVYCCEEPETHTFVVGSGYLTGNCYVMPFIQDSREGISEHRKIVMEIMSRGGGVGTNGSTLRPKHAIAKGVNGKSSGAVSWLDDLSKLTHLVEQGGSRR